MEKVSELKNTQGTEQDNADRDAMADEARDIGQHGGGLTGYQPFEVALQGGEQFCLVDPVRQAEDEQNDHRQQREQRVIGDCAGQQQALVLAEIAQHGQGEAQRMEDQLLIGFGDDGHGCLEKIHDDRQL